MNRKKRIFRSIDRSSAVEDISTVLLDEMKKYDIDKSFGIAARFQPPLNRSAAIMAQGILKHSVKCLRNSHDIDVIVERTEVNNGTINVDIISPHNASLKNPCLFYIHGGGFAYDAAPYHYKNAAEYALKTGSVIIFPHYRLTPEFSAPTQFNDCIAAWEWMLANVKRYKIDQAEIGIGGDSAGGYLAARLTNHVLKNHGNVRYQMLVYPVIDPAMRTWSMSKYTDTPMWNAKNNRIMWEWYDPGKYENGLLEEELPDKIVPTYIETAEFDCLHDEAILYAERLEKAGTDVTIYETRGTVHGFDVIKTSITGKAVSNRIAFMNRQYTNPAQ